MLAHGLYEEIRFKLCSSAYFNITPPPPSYPSLHTVTPSVRWDLSLPRSRNIFFDVPLSEIPLQHSIYAMH